jgi:folate-binding protein YgfZ
MMSPFLALPGAVAADADGLDAGVAAHYGNPLIEQRNLDAGSAIVDLSHWSVVRIAGADRLSWLNSFSSQKLDTLAAGVGAETLILDPQGHVEYDVRILDDGSAAWLIVDGDAAPALTAWLDRMRFTLRVEVADLSEDFAVIGAMGEPAALGVEAASGNGMPLVWADPWSQLVAGGWQYASPDDHPAANWRLHLAIVDRTALTGIAEQAASGTPAVAGVLALEALRIAAWRPRGATEVDERTIPHELDWMRSAVHLDKGCYRGQETIAKVHNLGHPPRRLVMLHLDGSDTVLPVHGDEVFAQRTRPESDAGWQVCGTVTSSGIHYELGPIALAVIRRGVPADAPLQVRTSETGETVAAAQVVVVPADAGATAGVPRLPRLGVRLT